MQTCTQKSPNGKTQQAQHGLLVLPFCLSWDKHLLSFPVIK